MNLPHELEILFQQNSTPLLPEESLPAVVAALGIEEQERRFFIGRLLQRQGETALTALAEGLANGEAEVRRSAVYLLGRLLAGPHPALTRALADEDAKVRKNAAVALGRMSGDGLALFEALQRESQKWVRPSMILAIGATQPALLQGYAAQSDEEAEALRKALDKLPADIPTPVFRSPVDVMVYAPPGLEDGIKPEAANAKLPLKPAGKGEFGAFSAYVLPEKLFELRGMSEFLLPLSRFDWKNDIAKLPLPPLSLLQSYHEPDVTIPYRLELRGLAHTARRTAMPVLVKALAQENKRWRNSPSAYSWELRLTAVGSQWQWQAKPCAYVENADTRFFYRVGDVPASIAGPTAGGILALAKPFLRENARVLDPCCGSGTMLFERSLAGLCSTTGVDIAHEAIAVAKRNDEEFQKRHKARTRWIGRDILRFEPEGLYDEIISNLPFGLRVGGHEGNVALYEGLFAKLPVLLKEGGLLVLLSQEVQLLDGLSRKAPVQVLARKRVTAGGLRPLLLILRWK